MIMQSTSSQYSIRPSGEHGSVLVIALVMLLVLTMMAVVGVQSTSMQERMAGNMRDASLAFQAAEAALRDAEDYINDTNSTIQFEKKFADEISGHYAEPDSSLWNNPSTWSENASIQIRTGIDHVALEPRYIIELVEYAWEGDSIKLGEVPDIYIYRVTSRSVGGSEDAVVILQSVYIR